jgi:hypothetical protein
VDVGGEFGAKQRRESAGAPRHPQTTGHTKVGLVRECNSTRLHVSAQSIVGGADHPALLWR